LEQSLRLASADLAAASDEYGSRSLVQQNIDLRKKLEEEHAGYKRKLQAYQDGQQRQASLVGKLQAKVSEAHAEFVLKTFKLL
jgi:rootletin